MLPTSLKNYLDKQRDHGQRYYRPQGVVIDYTAVQIMHEAEIMSPVVLEAPEQVAVFRPLALSYTGAVFHPSQLQQHGDESREDVDKNAGDTGGKEILIGHARAERIRGAEHQIDQQQKPCEQRQGNFGAAEDRKSRTAEGVVRKHDWTSLLKKSDLPI